MSLDPLTPRQRHALVAHAERLSLGAGEVLVRRGDLGGDVFLVESGALSARDGDEERSVVRPGDLLGEIAFLDGGPRSLDVVAVTECSVLCWRRDALRVLLRADPELHAAFLGAIGLAQARRMRRLTEEAAPPERAAVVELDRGRFLPEAQVIVDPHGDRQKLTPIEARLLAWFVARPHRVATHRVLLDEVWGYGHAVHSRTVYATVHRLRAKIELDPTHPRHLVAVPGGYQFEP